MKGQINRYRDLGINRGTEIRKVMKDQKTMQTAEFPVTTAKELEARTVGGELLSLFCATKTPSYAGGSKKL